MVEVHKYSCTSEIGAEILMFIIYSVILISVVFRYLSEIDRTLRNGKGDRVLSDQDASIPVCLAYALLVSLTSYMFVPAKLHKQEGKAQVILIWTVLIEIIQVRNHYNDNQWKSSDQLIRLSWMSFLVYSYAPLQGIMASLFVMCVYFSVFEVLNIIALCIANESYLIGKNPKLIRDWVKRIKCQDDLLTTPMNKCDYIVMGEENHQIEVRSTGYWIHGHNKPGGMLKISRVFQLNSPEGEVFTSAHPNWHDTCLSFALAKILRGRFAKLPVDQPGCTKSLDFVRIGLIDYIGRNQGIQTDGNDGEENPMERVFSIIQEELKFVSDFLHVKVPIYCYYTWYKVVDSIGVFIMIFNGIYLLYTIWKRRSSWKPLVEQEAYGHCFFDGSWGVKISSYLEQIITMFLALACIYSKVSLMRVAVHSRRWSNLISVQRFFENRAWNRSYWLFTNCMNNVLFPIRNLYDHDNEARVYSSVIDTEAETILFYIKVSRSFLARLPKWIRRNIPRSSPTVIHSNDAKKALLGSLEKQILMSSGTSDDPQRNNQMDHLNWACLPMVSTTESILIWHIATTLFYHHEPLSQNNDLHHVPFTKEVALELSSYCHNLMSYFPELLPSEVENTQDMYESVTKEILDIALFFDHKPTKIDRCNFILQNMWVESSVVGKGAMLTKDLIECAQDGHGTEVWTMLAHYWADMTVFIAPSDNVECHERILDREELITQLWALVTHAGIFKRVELAEHHDH